MSPLTRKRIQLWLAWSFANGLSVGTMFWLLVTLDRLPMFPKGGSLAIGVVLGIGVVAGVQQVLLRSLGWSAPWWWVASYLGIVLATLASAVLAVGGFLLATFAFGSVLGAVQIRACERFCDRPLVWPVASGLGMFAGAVQFLLATSGPEPSIDPFSAYLSGLAGGACYGMCTGLGLVLQLNARGKSDPPITTL